jgi:hypothetical protein
MADLGELKHIPLSESQRNRLTDYLWTELERATGDRKPWVDKLTKELEIYEALPAVAQKTFPWEDSSNLVLPIVASMVDTIFPRIYSTVFGTDPIYTFEEKDPDYQKHVKAVQFYIQRLVIEEVELPLVAVDWLLEAIIHGYSVVKVTWDKRVESVKTYDDDGEIITDADRVVKDSPVVDRVPLPDFFFPTTARSLKTAPWLAHRIRTYWGEIQQLERMGIYKDVERIRYHYETSSTDYVRKREEIEKLEPSFQEEYELYEFWLTYDYDDDGAEENLLVTYHHDSRTILRAHFNPYQHQKKPFRELVYWPRHDRIGGIGIAHMVAPMQDEISTLHNQNIDNRTVAITRMWEVVAGSTADRNFKGAAPGRKVKVDKLGEEIQPMEMGTPIDAAFEVENVSYGYAQQRTGVNSDFVGGRDMGSGGGRETATTTMVRMQEARTRFNFTMDSVRAALTDIGEIIFSLIYQFADREGLRESVGDEDGDLIREILSMPEGRIGSMIGLYITASTASINREAEKQNLLALVQLIQGHNLSFEMPLVQLVLNPMSPPELKNFAMDKLTGMHALFNRLLSLFDERNADAILGNLRSLEEAAQAAPPGQAGGALGGAPGGAAPGAAPVPGMGLPPGAMGGIA